MIISTIHHQDKNEFNLLAPHPLQSWEWGEFRKKTGIEVVRLGRYERDKLLETAQITIHPLPFTSWAIGYFPKGRIPSREMIKKIEEVGKQYRCIFVKLEPNIEKEKENNDKLPDALFSLYPNIRLSSHPLFTRYTFQLDLTKPSETLSKYMHPKTRYNIKVAQKHQVTVIEDNSDRAFENYLQLLKETTKRQRFYAHDEKYHRLMWETLKSANIAHLMTAKYQNHVLVAWILFLFNDVLYYPYGASSDQFKNTMANNLMMWEVIRFGQKNKAKIFDMWGALGPSPTPNDPWYGFHRFKQGYNPKLVEFVGSYDLIINPIPYQLYNIAHIVREKVLKIRI